MGNKINPTGDVYSMKLHLSKCRRSNNLHLRRNPDVLAQT
jgi:hypothetical protein